jgi:hypothetical protein
MSYKEKSSRDKPPTPTALDLEIAANGGSTMPLRMSPKYLKASKYSPNIINKYELIRTCQLQEEELARVYDLNKAAIELQNGIVHAIKILTSTLEAYKQEEEKIRNTYRDIIDDVIEEEDQELFSI